MIDLDGFRPNVGIILTNELGQVLWARRIGQDSWQFPQGGIQRNESPEQALYRELHEEVGLLPEDVEILAGDHLPTQNHYSRLWRVGFGKIL